MPERWVETARRAAEILAELGDSEPSAEIYASLSDWNGLAGLIGRCSPQWLKRGSYRTLEHWLSMLPADLKESDPWLLYWGGCAHLARNPREARDSLQRAFAMFAAKGEIRGALLAWAATCQAFFLAFDDLRPLGDWLERLHALVPSPESIPKELEARIAPGAFLCLMVARPADPEISHWEKILWRLVESDPDANLSAMAAPLLALHFAYTIGDRARSLRLREALRALQQTERMAPVSMVMLRGFSEVVFEFGFGGSTSHILKTLRGAMDWSSHGESGSTTPPCMVPWHTATSPPGISGRPGRPLSKWPG